MCYINLTTRYELMYNNGNPLNFIKILSFYEHVIKVY